uniref:Uncharacterized protein n=1 Tax=Alexandrium catenella TaxID=2925 RepID=A0A7S1WLE7_ALECA
MAADKLAVLYCLEFDRKQGTVSLEHAGASRAVNSEQLVASGVQHALTAVVFTVRGCFVEFTDVRVLTNASYTYEYETYVEVSKVPGVAGAAVTARLLGGEKAQEGVFTKVCRFFGVGGTTDTPLCPDGLNCVAAFHTRDSALNEQQKQHLEEHRHLCLYGKSCRSLDDGSHQQRHIHLEKPTCAINSCSLLTDVHHRAEYHHPGEWDVLLPCREQGCRLRGRHRQRYHHEDEAYRLVSSGLVRSVPDQAAGAAAGAAPSDKPSGPGGSSGGDERPRHYDFVGIDAEVQDSVDDMADIYNMDAVNGKYGDAARDAYGNPLGFDLAKDGAFEGFRLLIGSFCGELKIADLQNLTVKELQKKGWEVQVETDLEAFTAALRDGRFHVTWIVSSRFGLGAAAAAFVAEVRRFHESGRGLMIWGDNDPFFEHANEVLGSLFGFKLVGNTPGGKELFPGDALKPGHFGKHLICSGILKLHEGVTICYPERIPDGWQVVGTSSNSKPVLIAREAPSLKAGPGRVIVDNGFTKLYANYWTTAGTPRYVSNCCAWLALRERFKGPMRGFNPPPRV